MDQTQHSDGFSLRKLVFQLGWRENLAAIQYHVFTLWLFTVNDLKTMIFPSMAFALFNCLGNAQSHIAISIFIMRLPYILLWTWVNLLAFVVNNQRHPTSVIEDRLNKPWRPIPTGRISPQNARILGHIAYPIAVAVSLLVGGGLPQCCILAALGYIYNNPSGYNRSFFVSGALEVAMQPSNTSRSVLLDNEFVVWLSLIGAVVLSTVHSQDLYDQEGDAAAGRRTVPLVVGDKAARWSISLGVAFWSVLVSHYWHSAPAGYMLTMALGICVTIRTMLLRSVGKDSVTFRIYNVWLISIYSLPVTASYHLNSLS
ncbi:UbiA prenyltransferase family-domain-containing protein [Hypoxylon crocopeplum]|nr:UbiA prenyltransferase family-domain-containing protein [Hypoxylon crocopeplum]